MQVKMHVLNVSSGSMDGNLWGKVMVLNDEQFCVVTADGRRDKGIKPAKVSLDTSNDNKLAKELHEMNFPADYMFTLSQSVKGGEVSLKVIGFAPINNVSK